LYIRYLGFLLVTAKSHHFNTGEILMTTKQTPKKFQDMDTKVGDMLTCVDGDCAGFIYTIGKSYEVLENGLNDDCGATSACRLTSSTFVHTKEDTVSKLKYKVGDTVVITGETGGHDYAIGSEVVIAEVLDINYLGHAEDGWQWVFDDSECTLVIREEMTPVPNKTSSGGPSAYYDMPYSTWVTTNDQMEYLAEHKWGKYAIHLKDIFKGLCRWGDKSGTTVEYDSRKIIYYGCRVLMMVVGAKELRVYLHELLDDKQFQSKGED
jgi:hypothetical protein